MAIVNAVYIPSAQAQACVIDYTSSRTGTNLVIDLASGCTAPAKETFGAAAQYWADYVYSAVPIRINGSFEPLTCDSNSAVLGSAGPTSVYRGDPSFPREQTWYVVSLANSLVGQDLAPRTPDINMQFNSAVGTPGCLDNSPWYFDDGKAETTPSFAMDLYTVVLHEIGHGLGILSLIDEGGNFYVEGVPDSYSQFLYSESSGSLIPDLTPAERAQVIVDEGNLTWNGGAVGSSDGFLTNGKTNDSARMYVPTAYRPGSSVSHFDTALSPDELMEPFITPRSGQRKVLSRNLLRDIGWITLPDPPTALLGQATANTILLTFEAPTEDGGAAVSSYVATCGDQSEVVTESPATLNGLAPGTEYECSVASVSAVGESDRSATITVTTSDAAGDADGDGVPDVSDNCVNTPNTDQDNADADAEGDVCDLDDDNDGVPDPEDAFPLDASESADADGDGLGDNADACDNTLPSEIGEIDAQGCAPSDIDTDGDGYPDVTDAFPNDPTEWLDSDNDGWGDNIETEMGSDPYDANDVPATSSLQKLLPLILDEAQSN